VKALHAAFTVLLMTAAVGLGAQAASAPSSPNPAAAPGEPDIVMPQVILQIEDLSVEKVEAQLPPEEDLLPPERSIPVLSEGDLAVGEPTIPSTGAALEPGTAQSSDRYLASEVELGAGTQNNIAGSMSLKTLGQDPRFSLQFNHETLDGYSGHEAGAGFNLRTDSLNGGLKFRMGSVDTDLSASFTEKETGLQNRSPFNAALSRLIGATALFTATPLDWLSLNGDLVGAFDSLTLNGTTPLATTGALVTPSLSAEARFDGGKAGIEASYTFRADSGAFSDQLHRFSTGLTAGIDLPAHFVVDAAFGWFWNSAGLSLFPFSLAITGTPFEFITLSLDGGYRVVSYELRDVLQAHSLAYLASLADDRGWFGDASAQLTVTRDLSATMKLSFMASDAMPVGSGTQDLATGLFLVTQGPGVRFSSDLGVRWGISQSFSVSAGWIHEYGNRLFFAPTDSIQAELVGLEPSGRFGGNLSFSIAPTFVGVLQQPVVRMSGFWKVSDAVKLQIAGEDLLWPLLGGERTEIAPYVTPGFRLTGSVSMSL
jgi:hypothetical protein